MRKIWMIFEKQLLIMKMKVAGKEIQVIVEIHFHLINLTNVCVIFYFYK